MGNLQLGETVVPITHATWLGGGGHRLDWVNKLGLAGSDVVVKVEFFPGPN